VKAKVRAFFLSYGTDRVGADGARERAVLAGLGGWGAFKASTNAQLLPVRQVAVFRERLTAEGADLAPDEKAKRLASIDARLADLDGQMEKAKAVTN